MQKQKQQLTLEARIIKHDEFDERVFISKLDEGLRGTGYDIKQLKIIEDNTNFGLINRQFGRQLFILSYNVIGENLDYRQISGGLHLTRSECGTFDIETINFV